MSRLLFPLVISLSDSCRVSYKHISYEVVLPTRIKCLFSRNWNQMMQQNGSNSVHGCYVLRTIRWACLTNFISQMRPGFACQGTLTPKIIAHGPRRIRMHLWKHLRIARKCAFHALRSLDHSWKYCKYKSLCKSSIQLYLRNTSEWTGCIFPDRLRACVPTHLKQRTNCCIHFFYCNLLIALGSVSGNFWLPWSPDLSPADYFLWAYLKNRVFRLTSSTVDKLKTKITEELACIDVKMLRNVFSNLIKRAHACDSNG